MRYTLATLPARVKAATGTALATLRADREYTLRVTGGVEGTVPADAEMEAAGAQEGAELDGGVFAVGTARGDGLTYLLPDRERAWVLPA